MQIVVYSILAFAAAFAAFAMVLTGVGGLHAARKSREGLLPYFFYALFASGALSMFFSTRNFEGLDLNSGSAAGGTVASWATRITTLLLLIGAMDQIVRFFSRRPKISGTQAALILLFVFFWITNVILPAKFSTHPDSFEMAWVYPLFLVPAFLMMSQRGGFDCVKNCRNAILAFTIVSILTIAIRPSSVIEWAYTQGYLPGVPRFAGLAPHAILMGTIAALGIWCLMMMPLQSRAWNRAALFMCAAVLFLTQSKTVWVSFILTTPVLLYYQRGLPSMREVKKLKVLPVFIVLAMLVLAIGTVLYLIFGGGIDRFVDFTATKDGHQLMTFTGRDKIWTAAIDEWRKSPLFGYGLSLFDFGYRKQTGLVSAFHAHNQFLDSLGRTGSVGALGCTLYMCALFWVAFRLGRASGGLTTVLALIMIFRSVSEISISVKSTGTTEIVHYLLLAAIAASMARQHSASKVSVFATEAVPARPVVPPVPPARPYRGRAVARVMPTHSNPT